MIAGPGPRGDDPAGIQHLAIVRDGAHRLTDVAGGSEQHCRDALTYWIAQHGLPLGGTGLLVRVVHTEPAGHHDPDGSYGKAIPAVRHRGLAGSGPAIAPRQNVLPRVEWFQTLPPSKRNEWAVLAIRDQNRRGIWLRTWYCCACGAGVHSNFGIEQLEAEIEEHERLHGII